MKMMEKEVVSTIKLARTVRPASWIDRLIAWIEQFPSGSWLFYCLCILGFAILINATFWIDGSMPVGAIDLANTVFAAFVVYWLALYQYLTGVGSRALQVFSPLLDIDDLELTLLEHELATLPRWLGWLSIPLGFGFAAVAILGDPAPYGDIIPQTIIPYVGDILITGFLASTFFCFIIRSVRQLRMVHRLHARATNINLLKLNPAHAFSALTARTGIGIILVLILSFFLDPTPFDTQVDIITYAVTLSLAFAVFILPVIGIRDQLEGEKQRSLDETNDLLQNASDRLHNHVRGEDYQDVQHTREAIVALIHERELIEKISTWPWDPGTLRGFTSALLLPILLGLVTQLLEEIF